MRIVISFLVLLVLPFFLREKAVAESQLSSQPLAHYINEEFNYSFKYPNGFTPVYDQKKTLVLKHNSTKTTIKIDGMYGVSDKGIHTLCDHYLNPNDSLTQTTYRIINGNYGEISYKDEKYHHYEKLFHLGNRIVKLQITAPIEKSAWINEIKNNIILETNTDLI